MQVYVPFDARDPKTRLVSVLDSTEREAFALAMCRDVLAAIRGAGHDPELLSTASVDCDAPVSIDDRPLSTAVNAVLSDASLPVAIVMADLPLLTARALERLVAPDAGVVVAPGLGGGTNALVVDHPEFRVDYHGGSYREHCRRANDCGATLAAIDSFRLAVDIDESADLGEVLLHSEGHAAQWLREAGFELDENGGRTTTVRTASSS